jgi:Flp pilus assembly protein TadB
VVEDARAPAGRPPRDADVTAADVIHFVAAGVLAMTGSVLVAAGGLVSGVVALVCAAALCVRVYRRYQEYRRSRW